jgi:hypothetical protein
MYNETNEMLEHNEQNTNLDPHGNSLCYGGAALPFMPPANVKGDLRSSPRLAPEAPPQRRCDGSLRNKQMNSSGRVGWGLEEYPLAMVYSPYQEWRQTYDPDVALCRGTLFGELDLPLESINCRKGY